METVPLWIDITLGEEVIGGCEAVLVVDDAVVHGFSIAGVALPLDVARALARAMRLSSDTDEGTSGPSGHGTKPATFD
jgi:hypothetical protein